MSANHMLVKHLNDQGAGDVIAKAVELSHLFAKSPKDQLAEITKAMSTQTTGAGKELVAMGFSADVIQRVALRKAVASQFNRTRMTHNPFKMVVQPGPATAYIVAENAAAKASDPVTKDVIFNAKKFSAFVRISDELMADAIVDASAAMNASILEGLALWEEEALINGDTAATHMDTDVTAADDPRKAFDGLRKLTNAAAKVDLSTDTLTTAVRKAREKMGVYGVRPSELVIFTSIPAYHQLRDEESVTTVDKYGASATIKTGELANFDGIPVVISEAVRTNLDATGVYSASGTKSQLLIVNTRAFGIGDRQIVELEPARDAVNGQDLIIGRERIDFQKYFAATENPVAMVYNI